MPVPVWALALFSAGAAFILSRTVFPFLSINNDEPVNRLFADAIAHGHLFPPTRGLPGAFRPWLAAVSDGHYILKYTPVVPAMMVLSQLLTGGTGLYLAALAGATVVMTYLLAVEVLDHPAEALVATALLTLSPLLLIHSGLLLTYLPTLFLLETFAWAMIRGLSGGRRGLLALSGLALGLAFFARSYDALVFAAPLLLWALLGRFGRRPRLVDSVLFVLPALGALGGFLAFNWAATGEVLRPPFSLLESQDKLGFGLRRLYPSDVAHHFGLREGIVGLLRHGALLNFWVAGGSVLIVLAVVTVIRRRAGARAAPFVAIAVLLPLSYLGFWGPWNATVLWRGTTYVGPFYFLLLLLPTALVGARGLLDLWRWRSGAGVAAVAVMGSVTGVSLVFLIAANLRFTADNRALHDLVAGRPSAKLVFAVLPTPYLMHPSAVISNRWDLSGPVVYAVERGTADFRAAELFPDRTPYRLRFRGNFVHASQSFSARLEELRRVKSDVIELRLDGPEALPTGVVSLAVSAFGVTREYDVKAASVLKDRRLVIDRNGAQLAGLRPGSQRQDLTPTGLEVELFVRRLGSGPAVAVARERLPVRTVGESVEVLAPFGREWTAGRTREPLLRVSAGNMP